MLPKTSLPDLTMTVETITSISDGSTWSGGKLCPGFTSQQAGVRLAGVAFAWHDWIGPVSAPDQPLKEGFEAKYCPLMTWFSHCEPQKFTRWPMRNPPVLPPQITNGMG